MQKQKIYFIESSFFIGVLCLLLGTPAFSQTPLSATDLKDKMPSDSIRCMGEIHTESGSKLEARVEINYEMKFMVVNGSRENFQDIVKVTPINATSGIKSFYECKDSAPDCIRALVDSAPMELSTDKKSLFMGLHMIAIQKKSDPAMAEKNYQLDIDKVAYARAFITARTRFGNAGIFEYFDSKGELVSRMLILVPMIIECR